MSFGAYLGCQNLSTALQRVNILKKSNKIKSGFFEKNNQMVALWQD